MSDFWYNRRHEADILLILPGCPAPVASGVFPLVCLSSVLASAAIEPAAVFSDHAVLLKSSRTPVFGFAEPGEKVPVSVAGAEASAAAGADGRWIAYLDFSAAAPGPNKDRDNGHPEML